MGSSPRGKEDGMSIDGGARIGHEYRVTWTLRPFYYGSQPAREAEAVHVTIEQARDQYDGLRSMEAPADCAARRGTGHCDVHVWDVRIESRATGAWESISG
jgi:hypothetical protein